jgi:mRNA-degrading endonuclease RelE of RelBE toxin-antitoxin system
MVFMIAFIEHPIFTKQIQELMSDTDYAAFQQELVANPKRGKVMEGLGGLRKVRAALPDRGKSGSARVIYLLLLEHGTIFLFLRRAMLKI